MDVFANIVNWVGDKLNWVLNLIAVVLPDSPFNLLDMTPISQYLPAINYFVPISYMLSLLSAWTSAILIYYGYQCIMRWAKAVE